MADPVVHFELHVPDQGSAATFYSDLFGWKTQTVPVPGSGGRPGKAWVTLPFDSTLRLRANPYGFGRADADGLLIPLGSDAWLIRAGDTADYFLAGTFASVPKDGVGINVWTGEIKLPKAKVSPRSGGRPREERP